MLTDKDSLSTHPTGDVQNAEDYEILACSNSLILRESFTAVNNVKNTECLPSDTMTMT